MTLQMPDGKFLKWLMSWMIAATLLKIGKTFRADEQTVERLIADFLASIVGKFLFGAFWSRFPLVYVSAMIAGAIFVTAVVTHGPYSRSAAYYAFITVMWLSLFCIWIEPWLTGGGILTNLVLIFVGLFSVVAEIVVSVIWLILWAAIADEIKREL